MRIVILTGPTRRHPKAGDRRMLRGREHVRVPARAKCGAYIVNGGRPCFEWVPLEQAPAYLRTEHGRWIGKQRGSAA